MVNGEQPALTKAALETYAKRCRLVEGLLVMPDHVGGDWLVPVVPVALRAAIMKAAHIDIMGHLKNPRLYHLIATRVGWPGMHGKVNTYLAACQTCLNFNAGRAIQPAPPAHLR